MILAASWIYCPLYLYVLTGTLRDMSALPAHFRDFCLDDAKCFCCSNAHRHPDTGEELMCDRQLIYSILEEWIEDEQSLEPVLRTFDAFLAPSYITFPKGLHRLRRTEFRENLLPALEPLTHSGFLMRPLASAVFVASCPFLCDFVPHEFKIWIDDGRKPRTWNGLLPVYIFFASLCLTLGLHHVRLVSNLI